MKTRVKLFKVGLADFRSVALWCLGLSWRSSKLYTLVRIAADVAMPLLAIAAAFVGRGLINLLASGQSDPGRLVLPFALLFGIAAIRRLSQQLLGYSQAMQGEMISARISLDMMGRALDADMEHFDNPEYHDRLQSATQDSMSVSYIVWNVISCIGAAVGFADAFAVLVGWSWQYGALMLLAGIPAALASAKYTKLLYRLGLEQVNEQRQMGYLGYIAREKAFAQEIRLYGAGKRLKERYENVWSRLFYYVRERNALSLSTLGCCERELLINF